MATADKQPTAARRRILVGMPFTPRLDARHGGKAPAQLLLRLAERNDVALLCLRARGESPVDPAIGERCALVEEIPLAHEDSSWRRRARWALGIVRGLPPWATDCRTGLFAERLRRAVEEWRPEVVELHLRVMAQYAESLAGTHPARILIDYDPGSAWAADLVDRSRGARRVARRIELMTWRRYERATRDHLQAIVVFAERDVVALASTSGAIPVVRIPLAIEVPERALDPEGVEGAVLFVGGFGHPPNVDAAGWLAGTIFPGVRDRVPDATLELVGNEPGEEVLRLAGAGVAVHGSVPDVTPFLDRAAVVVAPIRIGGSMRMKVLEALAAGKALIATPRAAEGVDAMPGVHFLLADSADELRDATVELLLDPTRRRELGREARAWALDHLGWERSVVAFEELYDSLRHARG
jgi:glycosyltransferase involved in cell wall biosynthesis